MLHRPMTWGPFLERAAAVVDDVLSEIVHTLPEYSRLDRIELGDVRQSLERSVLLLEHRLHGRSPEQSLFEEVVATGARRYAQGISIRSIVEAHKRWTMRLWEEANETLWPDQMLVLSSTLLDQLESSLSLLVHGYVTALQSSVPTLEDPDGALVRRLCLGLLGVRAVADRLGLLPTEPAMVGVVVFAPSGTLSPPVLHGLRAQASAILAHPATRWLSGTLDGNLVFVYLSQSQLTVDWLKDALERLLGSLPAHVDRRGLIVALSDPCDSTSSLTQAYRQAMKIVRTARLCGLLGVPLSEDDVLLRAMLIEEMQVGSRLVSSRLQPLLDHDRRRGSNLLVTLKVYLQCGGLVKSAAKALHVHPNTVLYRLQRIEKLTGKNLRDLNDLLELKLALDAWEMYGS